MPSIRLPSTAGRLVDLGALSAPRTVIYCYPRTGRPGQALPESWDTIPAPRLHAADVRVRDHHGSAGLGAEVYGISTQSTAYQREMAERLHLPFEVLSDARFALVEALGLPTFEVEGIRLSSVSPDRPGAEDRARVPRYSRRMRALQSHRLASAPRSDPWRRPFAFTAAFAATPPAFWDSDRRSSKEGLSRRCDPGAGFCCWRRWQRCWRRRCRTSARPSAGGRR